MVKRIRETLSKEDRQRVDAYLHDHSYTFWRYMHIFFHSGARSTELLAMKRGDVDIANLQYKSLIKKGRAYTEKWRPIKRIVVDLWKELLNEAGDGDFLFSRHLKPGPGMIRADQITKRWRRIIKQNKELGITADFYSLRHSNTTEIVQLMGERTAMQYTGHTSPAMIRAVYDVNHQSRADEDVKSVKNKFA